MAFEWTSRKPSEGIATIYESNITLNKSASTHFETAYRVLLGLDRENQKIAIKPINKQEHERGSVPDEKQHKITVRPSYARVSNKKFIKEAAQIANINLSENNAVKYKTLWNSQEGCLVIDLEAHRGEIR